MNNTNKIKNSLKMKDGIWELIIMGEDLFLINLSIKQIMLKFLQRIKSNIIIIKNKNEKKKILEKKEKFFIYFDVICA